MLLRVWPKSKRADVGGVRPWVWEILDNEFEPKEDYSYKQADGTIPCVAPLTHSLANSGDMCLLQVLCTQLHPR